MGNYIRDTEFQTAVESANAQGRIALAREILAIEPEHLLAIEKESHDS